MRVVSMQSWVSYGYVGHAVATFALQRLGHEVWPVPTVVLSNHTGYPTTHGLRLTAAQVGDLVDGLDERGALAGADAVISGYLGDPTLVATVAATVHRTRAASPAATYTCDPVLGDTAQGFFVPPALAEAVRRSLVPLADLVTPNAFELEALTGAEVHDVDSALAAARALRELGPATVLVTSVPTGPQTIGMLLVGSSAAYLCTTPLLALTPAGTGDLVAALATAHLRTADSPRAAVEQTTDSVFAILETTLESGTSELAVIAAQEALARPGGRFRAERLG